MKIRKIIKIISLILLLTIVLGVLVSCGEVDYMKSNLKKYVYISEEDYKNYATHLVFDEITDEDVERHINQLLYNNRSSSPEADGAYLRNVAITVGDEVDLYYRGYYIDENGKTVEIDGGCNFTSDEYHTLGIGSGSFIPGFEEGLIGIVPNSVAQFYKYAYGTVVESDVVYLTYTAIYPNGETAQKQNARVDLSLPNFDEVYGEGFRDFLIGKTVGEAIEGEHMFAHGEGTAVYYDLKVEFVTKCEHDNNVLTIDAYFPADYTEKALRSKHVKFDVYVRRSVVYKTPEYNEEFISDVLKIAEVTLAEYEGETVIEKHRSMILEELLLKNEESKNAIIEATMWEHYREKAIIKKYPKSELEKYYNEEYTELMQAYNSYSSYYSNLESFAKDYYQLDEDTTWEEYINEQCEGIVREKLIFYYILRQEKLTPTKSEFNKLYEQTVQEYLDYYCENSYKEELSKITDETQKAARIQQIKEDMIFYYGEDYFAEVVYYDYALVKMIEFSGAKK